MGVELRASSSQPKANPSQTKANPSQPKAHPTSPKANPSQPKANPNQPKANQKPTQSKPSQTQTQTPERATKSNQEPPRTTRMVCPFCVLLSVGLSLYTSLLVCSVVAAGHHDSCLPLLCFIKCSSPRYQPAFLQEATTNNQETTTNNQQPEQREANRSMFGSQFRMVFRLRQTNEDTNRSSQ